MEKKNEQSLIKAIYEDTGFDQMTLGEKFLNSYLMLAFFAVIICAESLVAELVALPNLCLAFYLCKRFHAFDKIPEDE